ncbi:MAG: fumarate hydratase C-terminal domain-containing protein [Lentisphaeria bacterium]|nr:fumarate hydratase C-terminal domain-containing protein [Lentisphaeria bacterium]
MRSVRLLTPLSEEAVRALRLQDRVSLSGTVFSARDAVHAYLAGGGDLPCSLRQAVIYHCGPVVVPEGNGWRVTAAGPTTSMREEPYMAELIRRFRFRAVIGKGGLGPATLAACARYGCVYLHAVGGAAQVLATAVRAVRAVHMLEQFGAPEAVWELDLAAFPAVVTMDAHGESLHDVVRRASETRLRQLLPAAAPAPPGRG